MVAGNGPRSMHGPVTHCQVHHILLTEVLACTVGTCSSASLQPAPACALALQMVATCRTYHVLLCNGLLACEEACSSVPGPVCSRSKSTPHLAEFHRQQHAQAEQHQVQWLHQMQHGCVICFVPHHNTPISCNKYCKSCRDKRQGPQLPQEDPLRLQKPYG